MITVLEHQIARQDWSSSDVATTNDDAANESPYRLVSAKSSGSDNEIIAKLRAELEKRKLQDEADTRAREIAQTASSGFVTLATPWVASIIPYRTQLEQFLACIS